MTAVPTIVSRSGKLPASERRAAIIQAVRHIFAAKGFKATTTKELAEAAGVSEALLYRHFPTKEALFNAIQLSFCDNQVRERFEQLTSLKASTETLVRIVSFLTSRILSGETNQERAANKRMILRSLAEDGEFARLLIQPLVTLYIPKIEACLRAAIKAGEAVTGPINLKVGGWLAYNIAAMASFHAITNPPVVEYGVSPDRLTLQIVWFALRGLGISDKAIERYLDCEKRPGMRDPESMKVKRSVR